MASNATTHRGSTKLSATVSRGHFNEGWRNSIKRWLVIPGMELRHPWMASIAPRPPVVSEARR